MKSNDESLSFTYNVIKQFCSFLPKMIIMQWFIRAWWRWRCMLFFCLVFLSYALWDNLLLEFPSTLQYAWSIVLFLIFFLVFSQDLLLFLQAQENIRYPQSLWISYIKATTFLSISILIALLLFPWDSFLQILHSFFLFFNIWILMLIWHIWSIWRYSILLIISWFFAGYSYKLLPPFLQRILPSLSPLWSIPQNIDISLIMYTAALLFFFWWLLLSLWTSTVLRKKLFLQSLSHE